MVETKRKGFKSWLVAFAIIVTAFVAFFGLFTKTNVTYAATTTIGNDARTKYNSTGFATSDSVNVSICKESSSGSKTANWGTYSWTGASKSSSSGRFQVLGGQTFTLTSSGFSNPERVVYARVFIGVTESACDFTLTATFGSKSESVSGKTSTTDSIDWYPDLKGGGGTSVTWTLKNNSGSPLAFSSGYMEVEKARELKVNFDTNGGSGGSSNTTVVYWSSYSNISIPSRSGYKFTGYFTEKTGGTKYYNANGTPAKTSWDLKPATVFDEAQLYAQWEIAEQAVNVTAGTGVSSVYLSTNQNATSGSASGTKFNSGSTVYAFATLKAGYKHLSGWTKVSGTEDTAGAIYRVSSKTVGTSTVDFGTISADLITYYITYVLNGGTHGTTHPTSYKITTDTFIISDPTRTGYTFDGWSWTGFTGKVTSLTISKGSIGDRSLIANWTADTYTIAFDKNAEDAIGETASILATYDDTITLTSNGFSRVGYNFNGWATSSTGDAVFADGSTLTADQVNSIYSTKDGTSTLYVNWAYVEEIQAVVDKIKAIGTVEYTGTCKSNIEIAEAAYEELSDIYKEVIPEYAQTLTTARENYDNVDNVKKAIDAITPFEITEVCNELIETARDAYDALNSFEKGLVPNYDTLTHKEEAYEHAYNTIQLINAIGKVIYPDSEDEIALARETFEDLTDEEKNLVGIENLTTLAAAEGYYATVKNNSKADDVIAKIKAIAPLEVTNECKEKIDIARAAYNALENDEQRDLVYNYEDLTKAEADYAAAKATIDLIKALGDVLPTDECKDEIDGAKASYEALTADQKALVYNYKDLTDKDAAKVVVDKIAEITYVDPSDECKNKIESTRAAYNALTADQKVLVLNEANLIDAETAKPVSDLIEAIKPLDETTDCQTRINNARTAYNKLTQDQIALIVNKDDLVDLEAAKVVVDKIATIGDIDDTDACQTKITEARTAYDALTDKQKTLVTNYGNLTDREAAKNAVEKIEAIGEVKYPDSKEAIETARSIYDALEDDANALVPTKSLNTLVAAEARYIELYNIFRANEVIALINAIKTVEYTNTCKEKIDAARLAYNNLDNDDQKNLVTNYATLTQDEALYNAVDGAVKAIDTIGEVKYPDSKEVIETARTTYDALKDDAKALVPDTKVDVLEAAEARYIELEDLYLANRVKELIDAIGKVTLTEECKGRIDAARDAYDKLNDRQKSIVGFEYFAKLVAAEGYYAAEWDNYCGQRVRLLIIAIEPLEISDACKARIDEARKAYDEELTEAQQILVTNYDDLVNAETNYKAAKKVVDLIDQLPDKLVESRTEYNALTPIQKALVYNYNDLLDAEASKVDTLISAIGTVAYTEASKAKIEAARKAYNELDADAKDTVKNLEVLTNAETEYNTLKTKAINDAIAKINAIGEVVYTEESYGKIDAARKAFDAVLAADEANVTNKQTLLDAEATYKALKADHEAAENVDKLIATIGEVAYTKESKGKIDAAREAYGKLTEAQQKLVTKLDTLVAAENLYGEVDALATKINAIPSPLVIADATQTAINNAKTAYESLSDAAKAILPTTLSSKVIDNDAAYDVMKLIKDIEPFEVTDGCKERIDAAKKAYGELTAAQQALVANKEDLDNADKNYNAVVDQAKADAVEALIAAIGTFAYTEECKGKIDKAKEAYDKLTETQQKLVENSSTLTSAVTRYTALDNAVKAINAIEKVELTDECAGKVSAAFDAYLAVGTDKDLLPEATKKAYEDKLGAYVTMQNIAKIGDIAYTKECIDKLDTAKEAYESLSPEGKALVTNYDVVTNAYLVLEHIDAVVVKIEAILTPLVVDENVKTKITDARAAYVKLTKEEIALFPADTLELLENNEVAYNIMEQINVIPTQFSLSDSDAVAAIEAARKAYDNKEVSDAQRALVANYQKLLDAEVALTDLKIDAIKTVAYTAESKGKIDAARSVYDKLTEAQKALVTKKATLDAAETTYATLKAAAISDAIANIDAIGTVAYTKACYEAIIAAGNAYILVLPEDVKEITNFEAFEAAAYKYVELRKAAINDVITKIDAIEEVEYTSECMASIKAARAAINALLENDDVDVTNKADLTAAENEYNTLKTKAINDAKDAISLIGEVVYTEESYGKIDTARKAFDAVLKADEANVTNKQTLLDAEAKYAALKADHEAAKAVDALIELIPDPVVYTDECEKAITDARAAYDKLTEAQQELVEGLDVLEDAEDEYAALKADHKAAEAVDALIELIPDPVVYTPECEKAITDARAAYGKLTKEQQELVNYLPELEDAEDEYAALKADHEAAEAVDALIGAIGEVAYTEASKAKIDAAKTAYEALTEAQQELVTKKATLDAADEKYNTLKTNYDAAEAVDALIGAIGTVAYTEASKAKIDAARAAYEALTDAQKALVTKKATLDAAEAKYAELKTDNDAAADAEAKIVAIGTVAYTEVSKAKIDAARAAYNGLTNAQKALVKNTKVLTDAEASYKKLKEDNDKADQVEALINGIGKVEYTKESKAKMDAAKAAYNKLTAEQKKLVENYATLEKDMETYEHVGVAYNKINSIPKVENNESTKKSIEAARAAVDSLTAEEKAALPNTDKLVEAETAYNKLVKDQKTFNNIMTYAIIGGAALVLVIVIVFFARKKKEDANA